MARFKSLAIATLLIFGSGAAHAQQDPIPRLNQLGRFAGEIAVCKAMGFQTHTENITNFVSASTKEGTKAGMSETLAQIYIQNAMTYRQKSANQSIEALGQLDQDEEGKFAQTMRNQAQEWIGGCRTVAKDPIGRLLVSDASADDATLVTAFADPLLVQAGWASWQTPFIRAGGDMAEAVGICSAHLTPAKGAAYLADLNATGLLSPPIEDKAKRYFTMLQDSGAARAARLDLDATQCARLLTGRADKLKAAPR